MMRFFLFLFLLEFRFFFSFWIENNLIWGVKGQRKVEFIDEYTQIEGIWKPNEFDENYFQKKKQAFGKKQASFAASFANSH